MQTSLLRVSSAREAFPNHFPGRVGSDTDQQSECSHPHKPQAPRLTDPRIGLAIQHMVRHLNEPVRISTLAAVAGLSPSHFFSLFKSMTGFTPIAFFIGLRIQRACELLQDAQATIKNAAELVGYSDRYYFTRVFKQVVGVPPGAYRRTLVSSSALTPEGASSNVAREKPILQSLIGAYAAMKDFGIAAAVEDLRAIALAPHQETRFEPIESCRTKVVQSLKP